MKASTHSVHCSGAASLVISQGPAMHRICNYQKYAGCGTLLFHTSCHVGEHVCSSSCSLQQEWHQPSQQRAASNPLRALCIEGENQGIVHKNSNVCACLSLHTLLVRHTQHLLIKSHVAQASYCSQTGVKQSNSQFQEKEKRRGKIQHEL